MSDQPPCLIIILGVEAEPAVYRHGNASELERLADWLVARTDLSDLVAWSWGWRGGASRLDVASVRRGVSDEHEHDEVEGEPGDDDPSFGVLLFEHYDRWPLLSMRDLVPGDGQWLAEQGVRVEQGRIVHWDVVYDEDAEPGDPSFRPSALFPPSLAELEERAG